MKYKRSDMFFRSGEKKDLYTTKKKLTKSGYPQKVIPFKSKKVLGTEFGGKGVGFILRGRKPRK